MAETKKEKAAADAKAKVTAAATAAKEQSAAANAAAINAKVQAQGMLRNRVNFKKGLTEDRPVSYEALNEQLKLGQGLSQTALEATKAATATQLALDNFKYQGEEEDISNATRDAFAALTDLFTSYGLESLAGEIAGYMSDGLTASEALIKLKTNTTGAYAKRFAGNFTRTKNGLNAISEAEYINLENSYAETLKSYGLGNMINVNRDENYKTFANYIAGDISAVEFKDRVNTVVTRVQNSDPTIKATLKSFYPTITDNDLITYFLNPTENLIKLQEKVTASEIGAAALGSNLATNVTTATDLARYGVDQKMAREGYSLIAGILPTATKLGDIYNESKVKYTQAEGEAEVFKGSQDAVTKRARLASMERGSFGGSAGRLSSQTKTAGLI
jgi:hypothetical protein